MARLKEYLKIENDKGRIKMGLHSIAFDDHGHFMLYIPSLNMSAYGDTLEEAQEMLEVILEDFCESLYALPDAQRTEELKKYGWNRNTFELYKCFFPNLACLD